MIRLKHFVAKQRLVLVIAGVALLLWWTHPATLPYAARWLDSSAPRLPTDYVVPLPGSDNTRTIAAAALVKANLSARVAVIGTGNSPEVLDGLNWPSHERSRKVLIACGVSPDKIHLVRGQSGSTASDLAAIASIHAEDPNATIAIVTNGYHIRRTKYAASNVSALDLSRTTFVAADDDAFSQSEWWKTESGFRTITSEYLKLAYYMVKNNLALLAAVCILMGVLWFRQRTVQ